MLIALVIDGPARGSVTYQPNRETWLLSAVAVYGARVEQTRP